MALKISPQGRLLGLVLLVGAVIGGYTEAMKHGLIATPGILKSVVATRGVDALKQEDAVVSGIAPLPFPTNSTANLSTAPFLVDGWEWNAQNAVFLAMGGSETMKGSLMETNKVNAHFKRTDSNDVMKSDIIACANQLHDGATSCTNGAAALIVMGDSGGQWLSELNATLSKLDKGKGDYDVQMYAAVGRSNGEDALLGPAEWKDNPKAMLGKTIVGVIRDGDWNIALAFEGFNNLKNNPDLHTYNPNAVNWMSAPDDDYIKAVTDVYIPGKCEQRPEVDDTGHKDGKIANVCPDGVVTWTPGDEQAVHGKPGTFKIISSREYSAQMPAVLMVIKKFANDNPDVMTGYLSATFQAADQIKAYPNALKKAADIAAKVYGDNTGDYWYKYAVGVRDPKTGQLLGGSAVFNLQDNLQYFGLKDGFQNNMKATYETFARIDMEQYPSLFKDSPIPPYAQAVNTHFIRDAEDALNNAGVKGADAETTDYAAATSTGTVVSTDKQYIVFATNSAVVAPEGRAQLAQLATTLGIAKALAFEIDGYTDNVGDQTPQGAQHNIDLSAARAQAVKTYLQTAYPHDFPNARFKAIKGLGSANPVAPNDTADNKQRNRRVEILQIGNDD